MALFSPIGTFRGIFLPSSDTPSIVSSWDSDNAVFEVLMIHKFIATSPPSMGHTGATDPLSLFPSPMASRQRVTLTSADAISPYCSLKMQIYTLHVEWDGQCPLIDGSK